MKTIKRFMIKEDGIIVGETKVSDEIMDLVRKHDEKQIRMGFEVEKEHNVGVTDVVKSWLDVLKIALAHLEEDPEYYTKLKRVEGGEHFQETVNETTLSRVKSHFEDVNVPVVLMSAFRSEYNYKQNIARLKQMMKDVRTLGWGFIKVDGHWVENKGTKDEVDSKEESIIIVGKQDDNGSLESWSKKLMKKFGQEAIIFKPKGETSSYLVFSNGSKQKLGNFRPKIIGQAYTKLRGRGERTFTFD